MRVYVLGAVALAIVLSPASAQTAPAGVDPFFGDGGVSTFYRWDEPLKAPGLMLRQAPVGDGFFAEHASIARRILYSSTDGRFGRGIIESSGLLYLPRGKTPVGGWPLLVWGHGTFGIADVCAPSWKKPTDRDGTYVDSWLKAGFAVVAPDYQGLGTRGVHPYLQRAPEGYSTLDAARAALAAYPGVVSNQVILTGQSQGSGAVLNATSLAHEYAPTLNLRGTIATALVWRASDAPQRSDVADPDASRYIIMREMAGGGRPGSPAPESILTDKGRLLRDAARTGCSRDLAPVVEKNGITPVNMMTIPPERAVATLATLAVPARNLGVPLFVATGLADRLIAPNGQYAAVRALCRYRNRVAWRKYPAVGHSGTSNAAFVDALAFALTALAGTPRNDCASLSPPGPLQTMDPTIPFNN